MASRKLLRQYVTDYQRDIQRSVAEATKGYEQYSNDTNAFNALLQKQYDASAAMNKKSDLDLVGATYYDREAGRNVAAGGTTNPLSMQTFNGFTALEGGAHNTYANFVPGKTQNVFTGYGENGEPQYETKVLTWNAMSGGKVVGSIPDTGATTGGGIYGGGTPVPFRVPYYAPDGSIGAYWDSYDKVWRNAASAGAPPTQREVKDPNLTVKDINTIMGKAPSQAAQAMVTSGKNSAFADPKDPNNLKEAGILTRVIAGQL